MRGTWEGVHHEPVAADKLARARRQVSPSTPAATA